MTVLDDTTVVVYSPNDLASALQSNNGVTMIYLGSNIQLVNGIAILASKNTITIDGLYPLDETGMIHTLTDISSTNEADTIYINSASTLQLTIQNLNMVGKNYYGTFHIYEATNTTGVILTYKNVTYTGPQMTHHGGGLVRYLDCTITIWQDYSSAQEVAELYQLEIGGDTVITHNSTSNAIFWFRGYENTPYFRILPGANVQINSTNYGIYTSSNPVEITVHPNARLLINTANGMFGGSSHQASSVLIDRGANFTLTHNTNYWGNATFYCKGAFTVSEDATVYMKADYSGAGALINFTSSGSGLTFRKPRSVVLYNRTGALFAFSSLTPFSIISAQLNNWIVATLFPGAGTLLDVPLYTWRKPDDTDLEVTANVSGQQTTILSSNFTANELLNLPSLALLQLHLIHVLSMGRLSLQVDPIADDYSPISGVTEKGAAIAISLSLYTAGGAADNDGRFSSAIPMIIPVGTIVTITTNTPFLYTTKIVLSVEAGEIYLASAPEEVAFTTKAVSIDPLILGRVLPDWFLSVYDGRARNEKWYLYATVDKPLTTEDGLHSLLDAICYVDQEKTIYSLSPMPTLVYVGEGNGGSPKNTEVSWKADRGILLQVTGEPFESNATYSTVVTWLLSKELIIV